MSEVKAFKRTYPAQPEAYEASVGAHPWKSFHNMSIAAWQERLSALLAEGAPGTAIVGLVADGSAIYCSWKSS